MKNKMMNGDSIGELKVTPTKTQVFMFSAITWNRHQIHYNKDQAVAEGFPDVAVQRGLIGNFLARLVMNWAGQDGKLERLQWKVVKSAFPGFELCCKGEINAISENKTEKLVDCTLQVLNSSGEQVATGEARVRFLLKEKSPKENS